MKILRLIISAVALTGISFISNAQSVEDYAGEYQLSDNPIFNVLKIEIRDGKVFGSADGSVPSELIVGSKPDAYKLSTPVIGDLTFVRSDKGVFKLIIDAPGLQFVGIKAGNESEEGDSGYAATYKMEENEYIKKLIVKEEDGKLFLGVEAFSSGFSSESIFLIPTTTADTFRVNLQGFDGEISFGRSAGKVKSIKVDIASIKLTGNKLPGMVD
jgi:hypothetical protein